MGLGAILHTVWARPRGGSSLQTLGAPWQGSALWTRVASAVWDLPGVPVGRGWRGVRDFHQFSLKKTPALPATPYWAMGHYSSSSPSPAAVGSSSGDAEKVGGRCSLAPQAGGVWASGAAVRSGPGTLPAWHGGQELGLEPPRGQAPLPLPGPAPEGLDGAPVIRREWRGDAEGTGDGGRSCPSVLLPGREIEPQDVSAACANSTLAERNNCLLSRAHRKISFPEHLLI